MKQVGIGAHQLATIDDVKKFVFAGKAIFTLRSKVTNDRYTFKVQQPKGKRVDAVAPYFVSVFDGTDNNTQYSFLGTVFQNQNLAYVHSKKSKLPANCVPEKAINFLVNRINLNDIPSDLEIWHEGRCGCCGKKLTVPESITNGLGPVCAGKR